MTINEKSREHLTEERLRKEHLQDMVHHRAEETVKQETEASSETNEQLREHITEQRHHQEHLQDAMHMRAEEEIEG